MRRKWLLLTIGGVFLGLLAVMYSLVGAMSGVYSCPDVQLFIASSRAYMILRGEEWYYVQLGDVVQPEDDEGPYVEKGANGKFIIRHGIWSVTFTDKRDGTFMRACSPWNLADVYALTFGRDRSVGRAAGSP